MKRLQISYNSIDWFFLKVRLNGLILAIFLVVTQSANAGVIALNSEISLKAIANSNSSGNVVDIDQQSQLSSLNNLSASVSAISTSPGASLEVSGSASASWVNAAQGQVLFNDIGLDSLNNTSNSFADIGGWHGEPLWSYNFIADVNGVFTMDWSVFVQDITTTTFGLGGFRFALVGNGGQSILNVGAIGSTNSGTVTRNISAGLQYTALLTTSAGLTGGIATRTQFMDGTFNWSMDSGPFESVPEPSMLSMLGIGLAGLAIRTRRKKLRA